MLIQELTLHGLLSFGPDSPTLKMQPLNVLIGPNGSGKSNLIEAIRLLTSAPGNLVAPMRRAGGGVVEWMWRGLPSQCARIEAIVSQSTKLLALRHVLEFSGPPASFEVVQERIEHSEPGANEAEPRVFYRLANRKGILYRPDGIRPNLSGQALALDESILSQRKDPDQYPELTYLGRVYAQVQFYGKWSFGRSAVFRVPQAADLPNALLAEDFSNLGLFLNHLRSIPKAKKAIVDHLRDLYAGIDDFDVRVKGGTVELFLTEGDFVVPARRLSDGTLRYLCLLAILCDPEPPPLICIEEPELGLHPDMLPKLADLLVEASSRTQLVVTTHSDILVDAMTEHPESVVVFEKRDGQTHMNRLSREDLKEWLERYRLGQLWISGEIGGTRW